MAQASKSLDKLEALTQLAASFSGNIESCEYIKLTWTSVDTDQETMVVPEIEIKGLKLK